MARRDETPRDLLFGLLALQIGLIDQDQLVAAFSAWSRAKGRSLAEILLERGSIDAEPLIVGGYEGVKAREAQVTPPEKPILTAWLNKSGERVVRLYKEWGKPEKAAEWAASIGPPAK